VLSVVAAKSGIGLSKGKISLKPKKIGKEEKTDEIIPVQGAPGVTSRSLVKATFPLWGTIAVLVVTRISQLGIRSLLTASEPGFSLSLGPLGDFSVSASLVLSLENILHTDVGWTHPLLYVPSIIPFVLVSLLTFLWYGSASKEVRSSFKTTLKQMKNPTFALLGALVFVNLIMMGGENAAVNRIGILLADITGEYWTWFASFMGALGSFFSGSATISNLTFAGIQDSIAGSLGLDRTLILALQSVGASLGNMVCINNIVAVASVLALTNVEGKILKRTAFPMLVYGILAGTIAVLFF
jgi:lactate permease